MICVLTAVEEELEVALEVLGGGFSEDRPEGWPMDRTLYRGRVGENPVVLTSTGMGKICTASTAELISHILQPQAFFFCGCAGSLVPGLEVGDLVIADSVSQWDLGVIYPESYESLGSCTPGGITVICTPRKASPVLLDLARKSASSLALPGWEGRVEEGGVVTGDKAVWSRSHREWLAGTFGAVAVDMESAALAEVAAARKIPFLVVRGISDTHEAELSSLHRVLPRSDISPARIFLRRGLVVLFHPLEGVRMLRLMRATKDVTRPAASLVRNILREWDLGQELDTIVSGGGES